MSLFSKRFARFRGREHGSATVEFVFLFPLFMAIFLMGFEAAFYMIRNVMLERAVDISVRDIRLGNGKIPDYDAVVDQICDNAIVFSKCNESMHVYMEEVSIQPGAIAAVTGPARCINRFSDQPQFDDTDYNIGDANTMMVVQVCAVVSPMFPTTGIGLGLQRAELGLQREGFENTGMMAIVATTAFVNEPGTRAMAPTPPPATGGGTGGAAGGGGTGGASTL